jgi:hypothetical protein
VPEPSDAAMASGPFGLAPGYSRHPVGGKTGGQGIEAPTITVISIAREQVADRVAVGGQISH